MICERCKEEIPPEDDIFDYYGKKLCEDCYIGAIQPPRSCDPAAVSSATATRAMLGQSGTQGLTPLQKRIYEFIKEQGKVTREDIQTNFDLPQWELEKQLAILRHCELIRGFKEENTIFMTLT